MKHRRPGLAKAQGTVMVAIDHPEARACAGWIERKAREFLRALQQEHAELSICLTSDRRIRALNKTWREKDQATDVLSFPAGKPLPGTAATFLGDVVISMDTTRARSKQLGRTLREELARYLAHGLLHLLGYDHVLPKQARRMAAMESVLLGAPGMVPLQASKGKGGGR